MTGTESGLRDVVSGLRSKWGAFPERIADIPGFPYSTFAELRTAIESRAVLLQRFSFEYGSSIFALVATKAEQAYLRFLSVVGFGGPLLGLVLAFTVRWWWLIPGILTPFVVMREYKKVYNSVIYRAALGSELAFCFLYRVKQVCLTAPDHQGSVYWKDA
jgi:hypothetical protein